MPVPTVVWGDFRDSEALSVALSHTDVRAMQLLAGAFHARLGQGRFNGWTLQYVEFLEGASTCSGSAAPDRHSFIVPLAVGESCRLLGKDLGPDEIGVYAPRSEHADVTTAGLSEVVVTPPANVLEDAASRGELFDLPKSGSHIQLIPSASLGDLRQTLWRIGFAATPTIADERTARAIADELELAIIAALSDTSERSQKGRPPLPRQSVMRRVADALNHDDTDLIHASELARFAGVSYPTLRRIFLEWFGTSPSRYLLLKRLYFARQRLLSGEFETVSDAAMSCGFWELGRFARRYRELFGELPSTTLSRTSVSGL